MKNTLLLLLLSFITWNLNTLQAQTQAEIEQMISGSEEDKKPEKKEKTKLSKEVAKRNKEVNKKNKTAKKKTDETEEVIEAKTEDKKPVKAAKEKTEKISKLEKVPKQQKKPKAKKDKKPKKTKGNSGKEVLANNENNLDKFGMKKLIKVADKLAQKGSYYNAIEYYNAALFKAKKDKHKIILNEKLGEANYVLRDYKQAEKYYTKAVSLNENHKKHPLLEFQLANTYKYLAKYDTALTTYSKFLSLQEENDKVAIEKKRARLEKKGTVLGRDMLKNEDKFSVENLGENVNGPFSDYGPEMIGDRLFFSKIYTDKVIVLGDEVSEKEFSKIYYSEMYDDEYGYFQDFASNINQSKIHVGNPSFTKTGNTVYFTECTLDKTMQSNCRIMKSNRENNEWQKPQVLNANINFENSNNTQPQIADLPNGENALFFVSNRIGSKGGKDIWMSGQDEEGNFQRAKRVNSPINTSYDEVSPFYHTQTNTLYFSSNGHISIGGFDVFKVEGYFENEDDLEVKNAGFPINSSLDDYDFILNNSEVLGFLTSNRKGIISLKSETCCDDIFVVKSAVVDLFVTGLVYAENETSRSIYTDADIYLYNSETNEKIEQISYKGKQGFITQIEKDKEYRIVAVSDDFEEESVTFSTKNIKKSDTLQYDIFLKQRNLIDYQIAKVYYQFNQSKLREDAPDTLRKVINFMNAYPDVIVEVGSHTDSKGTDEYNLKLSERRSLSVKNYLIYQGKISEKRLVNKSYGESQPAFPNTKPNGADNPEGRDKNRRTEFKIIGKLDTE